MHKILAQYDFTTNNISLHSVCRHVFHYWSHKQQNWQNWLVARPSELCMSFCCSRSERFNSWFV